jgi:hypothetical protein
LQRFIVRRNCVCPLHRSRVNSVHLPGVVIELPEGDCSSRRRFDGGAVRLDPGRLPGTSGQGITVPTEILDPIGDCRFRALVGVVHPRSDEWITRGRQTRDREKNTEKKAEESH